MEEKQDVKVEVQVTKTKPVGYRIFNALLQAITTLAKLRLTQSAENKHLLCFPFFCGAATKYTGDLEKRFKTKVKDIDNTLKLMPSQQHIGK
ncbi:unnamed protein product [Rhizophagus irregularis]|nr:unnamed protein product [Rhizophagus irregularis]CAB5213971.1 unnamed protein product [Rhizophagus irregularis]